MEKDKNLMWERCKQGDFKSSHSIHEQGLDLWKDEECINNNVIYRSEFNNVIYRSELSSR